MCIMCEVGLIYVLHQEGANRLWLLHTYSEEVQVICSKN